MPQALLGCLLFTVLLADRTDGTSSVSAFAFCPDFFCDKLYSKLSHGGGILSASLLLVSFCRQFQAFN